MNCALANQAQNAAMQCISHKSSPLLSLYMQTTPIPSHPVSFKLQTIPHTLPHPLLEFRRIIPPQGRRLHIRRTLVVRLSKHAHNRYKNLFNRLNRRPPFRRMFVVVWIVAGRVEDGDAD